MPEIASPISQDLANNPGNIAFTVTTHAAAGPPPAIPLPWFYTGFPAGAAGLLSYATPPTWLPFLPLQGAICGVCDLGIGVRGESSQGPGVFGHSSAGPGIYGVSSAPSSNNSAGVYGNSIGFDAVVGETSSEAHAGVTGRNLTTGGAGVYGVGGQYAGKFDGNVLVNGSHHITSSQQVGGDSTVSGKLNVAGDSNITGTLYVATDITMSAADCAEDFYVDREACAEPGTVVILDSTCVLQVCRQEYDKRVVGVLSGAGPYRPALILDRTSTTKERMPVALFGKVYCKVDANYAPIEVGDLLTTSLTAGHAMKAVTPERAFGAVIGKSMQALNSGQGLIPILVALQ